MYKCGSNLEKKCRQGEFVITAELGPPRGNNLSVIETKAAALKGIVDAVNITDNQTAIVRMSSMATAALLIRLGLEPVMQIVTRDRNRIALMSDIIGARALGIKNILCLSGDHQVFGNHAFCKNVYDVDSIQLLSMLKIMRDQGVFPETREPIDGNLDIFIGAADAPFSEPVDFRPYRLRKKIDAGADFIQTQCIFDIPRFRDYMQKIQDLGVTEQSYILAGIIPLKSLRMAEYMASKVPGVIIPDIIMKSMKNAATGKASEEGIKICCDIIQQVREIPGLAGVHLMAIEWEHRVAEIIERSALRDKPAD
ncbi:MAG TPA: methylenetetrahydrofolate reductase [Spirochaetota bacterium]|nr:methylenetetrahydrofolate reductase [Spirochaetota bacterium]HPR49769.1 methylenetetrahydrofolate reductase [Spirochaetota bacterium]